MSDEKLTTDEVMKDLASKLGKFLCPSDQPSSAPITMTKHEKNIYVFSYEETTTKGET